MMKIKKIAMQLCLSSAVLAAMPAFAAEVAQSSAQHYMVKNLNIGAPESYRPVVPDRTDGFT